MPRMPEGHDDNAELNQTNRIYERESTADLAGGSDLLIEEFDPYTAIGKVSFPLFFVFQAIGIMPPSRPSP